MKFRIVFILLIFCRIGLSGQISNAPWMQEPVTLHGSLHVEGTKLLDVHNQPVVLRGMSFGWHNFWPRFYHPDAVSWLHRDWACSVVRAAMGIELWDGYKTRPDWSVSKIKTVVDAAISENIYVIIDWHSHNINLDEAKTFFSQMAAEYGKYPHVIYEIFNEPDYESWDEVKAFSIEVIQAIRAVDPDNIILVGSTHWAQDLNLVAGDPLKGFTNLMYTMHFYAGTHKQWLRDRCDEAMKKGIPIFVSECAGMDATGDGPIDQVELMQFVDWMEKNLISWLFWSVSDKDESCSVLQSTANTRGQWPESDLKEWGILSRKLIRLYNFATSH
jgi:endoglucanase